MRYDQTLEPRTASLTLQGGVMKIQLEASKIASKRVGGGQRAEITGFSKQARLRFARSISSTSWPVTPAHITLTYGRLTPTFTLEDYKLDLEKLQKWCCRRNLFGFWALHFQQRYQNCIELLHGSGLSYAHIWELRAAPHFHLLLCDFGEQNEKALRKWWASRSGNDSKHGVHVTYRDHSRAPWYLALHGSKTEQTPSLKVGKWWGKINKKLLDSFQRETHLGTLSPSQEARFRRICRRLLKGRFPQARMNVAVFVPEHLQRRIIQYLNSMETDKDPFVEPF